MSFRVLCEQDNLVERQALNRLGMPRWKSNGSSHDFESRTLVKATRLARCLGQLQKRKWNPADFFETNSLNHF